MDKEVRMTLRISEELKEHLAKEAKKENRNLHNMVVTILLRYFDSHLD
jgi:predicted HicB family RNase H-like nuclease